MFGHGGGGWDDWPHFSRMKISSFDFVRFGLRLFLDAHASTWDTSPSQELEFAAGTTRYVSSADLKMQFPGVVGCRSVVVTMNDAGPSPQP